MKEKILTELLSIMNSRNKTIILFVLLVYAATATYRYSEHMCESCVYQDLNVLRQLQDSLGYDNLLILPAFSENKYSQLRLSNELKGFRYKNIPEEDLGFPIDKQTGMETRYLGYINSEGDVEMCFMPLKNRQELTWRYLSMLRASI